MAILGPDGRPLPPSRQRLLPGRRISRDVLPIEQLVAGLERPDTITLATYERMVTTDETVGLGVEFVVLSVASRLGEYTHEDSKIQEFVRANFEQMRGSIRVQAADLLSSGIWAGFGLAEKVWRAEGGRWWLDALPLLDPVHLRIKVYDGDGPGHGQIEEVYQRWGTQWQANVPGHKLVHLISRPPGVRPGNPYGISRLKGAWKWWYPKDLMLKAWALTLQRYGTPLALGRVRGVHDPMILPDGTEVTRGQHLLDTIMGLDNTSGLVVDLGEGEDIEFVRALGAAVGGDFEKFEEFANRMILRALLVPPLLWEGQDGGSRALGSEHFDAFILGLEHKLLWLTEGLLEQAVREIIWLNFGPQRSLGAWATLPLQPDDQERLARVFFQLVNGGWISPEILEDLNIVRERMGFPLAEEGSPLLLPRTPAALPAPAAQEDMRARLSLSLA